MTSRLIIDYNVMETAVKDTPLSEWVPTRPAGAKSSWNVKPTHDVPVAYTTASDNSKLVALAHWRLAPAWHQERGLQRTFIARSEYLLEKPIYAAPFVAGRRCVIPVTGYYEWIKDAGSTKPGTPHAIYEPDRVLALAGLYEHVKSPSGESVLAVTVLTRPSAGQLRGVHPRMPIFVADDALDEWLDPHIPGSQHLLERFSSLAEPVSERLSMHRVAPLHGNGPRLIRLA